MNQPSTKWKGPFLSNEVIKIQPSDSTKPIKITNRASTIPSSFEGKIVAIHNGKAFKEVLIQRNHIGFKFGEFSFTRYHGGHKNLKKQQKVKSKKKKK